MPHAYLGVASLKASLTISSSDTSDDARLLRVLEAVSQAIDDECARVPGFQPRTATRYYAARCADELLLAHDLLSVTSLKTDPDGDRVYDETWATTDYDLAPDNAAAERSPYWKILTTPNGNYGFPVGTRRGVEIVGLWGYWLDLLAGSSTLGAAITTTTGTSVTLTTGHAVEAGHTLLIDSEQLYVSALSTNTATVERGVNGTTAATHLNAAAVSIYRYPGPVIEAARLMAARIAQRHHAPFGVTGSAEMGTVSVIARVDPDVKMLLSRYRSGLGMAA